MIPPSPATPRYRSLEASREALGRAAPLVRFAVLGIGVAMFLDQVRPLISDGQFTWGERRVMGAVALVTLGGSALAAWVAGRLLRAAAELLEAVTDGAESAARATHLMESHLLPNLIRAADALERLAAGVPVGAPTAAAASVRQAMRERRWGRAESLLEDLAHAPEAARLAAELAEARRAEVETLRTQIEEARAREDVGQAVACRDALTLHLRGEALDELDRDLARWVHGLASRKVKEGSLAPELILAVSRAVESLADTPEGARLQAALPALSRRAGLCPRCARPYRGGPDLCPDCLSSPRSSRGKTRPEGDL